MTPEMPETTMAGGMAVVGPQFCVAQPLDLTIPKKTFGGLLDSNEFDVTDGNGNVVFNVWRELRIFNNRRVLMDAAGNPILTMQTKMFSGHGRREVFRGHGSDPKDLIFSMKRSSRFGFKDKLLVFMASNSSEQVCDFRIEGNLYKNSSTVYLGESNTIIAQMSKKKKAKNTWFGKRTFGVTVHPYMDSAFIVALAVITKEMYEPNPQPTPTM